MSNRYAQCDDTCTVDCGHCKGGGVPVGRCADAFSTPYGDRRCDLAAGHDGHHIRNDGCGRPEYYWGKP